MQIALNIHNWSTKSVESDCQLRIECLRTQWISIYKFGKRTLIIGHVNDYKIDKKANNNVGLDQKVLIYWPCLERASIAVRLQKNITYWYQYLLCSEWFCTLIQMYIGLGLYQIYQHSTKTYCILWCRLRKQVIHMD